MWTRSTYLPASNVRAPKEIHDDILHSRNGKCFVRDIRNFDERRVRQAGRYIACILRGVGRIELTCNEQRWDSAAERRCEFLYRSRITDRDAESLGEKRVIDCRPERRGRGFGRRNGPS